MPSRPAVILTPRFSARYVATKSSVPVIRGEVEAIARECGIAGEQLADLRAAVSDAATNAVGLGSAGSVDARVHLRVELTKRAMLVGVGAEVAMTFPSPDVAHASSAMLHE